MGEVKALATRLCSHHPRIDVLVNNHARIYRDREITEDQLEANFAECSLYLATADEVGGLSGKYFVDCCQVEPSKEAHDSEAARRLWAISASLSGLDDAVN